MTAEEGTHLRHSEKGGHGGRLNLSPVEETG